MDTIEYATFRYDTVEVDNRLLTAKPVFRFNRIVAKCSVFHCFVIREH